MATSLGSLLQENTPASFWRILGTSTTSHAAARATSSSASSSGTTMALGQSASYSAPTTTWNVYRVFLKFDTSAIPTGATISQVNLTLTCTSDTSTYSDFDVQIVKDNWADTVSTQREADYDGCLAGPADDSIWRNTLGISTNAPHSSGNLSTAWPSIGAGAVTRYSLRSSRDKDANDLPAGAANSESITVAAQDHATAGYRPVLTIAYSTGCPRQMMFQSRLRRAS